ncbi:MAG: hypothetical protein M3132_08945 [Actinomycetia bacterium]|nr:hypothetical protein [Actinomycetes bacterium]
MTAAGSEHGVKLYLNAGHSLINDYAPWYTTRVGPIMAVEYLTSKRKMPGRGS